MIYVALAALVIDQKFAPDLEQALTGQPLSGAAFHKAIDPVLRKHDSGYLHLRRTVGDDRALVMAVTTRGSAEGDAYLFFIWPEGGRNHVQALQSVTQYDKTWVDPGEAYWKEDRLVILGQEVKSGSWETASLFAFENKGGKWSLTQHLDTDHEGEAAFRTKGGSANPGAIDVSIRVEPKHLRQAHVEPHLRFSTSWKLKGNTYFRTPELEEETPLSIIDRLTGYVHSQNRGSFNREVPKKFRANLWRALRTCHEASSESESDHSSELTLDSNYFLRFAKENVHWMLVEVTHVGF